MLKKDLASVTTRKKQSCPDTKNSVTQKPSPQHGQYKDFTQLNFPIVVDNTTEEVGDTTPNTTAEPCRACGCDRAPNIILENPRSTHYASLRCAGCDMFLGWIPKPTNVERRREQRQIINRLLENPRLTIWERDFLSGLGKKISPKQVEVLQKINNKHGGVA